MALSSKQQHLFSTMQKAGFRLHVPFETACSQLRELIENSGRRVPTELTVNDLIVAVTNCPREAPALSHYDSLDLLINGNNSLIYEQVCRHIDLLGGPFC